MQAPPVLFGSFNSSPTPFYCGTLVPYPWNVARPRVTDALGEVSLTWPAFPDGLSGESLYLQYGVSDAAAPCGVSLSNAVRADVP